MDNCDWEANFTPVMSVGIDGKLSYDCISGNNGDKCLEANCHAYTWFTKNILDIFLDQQNGELPNYSYKEDLGFDSRSCHQNSIRNSIEDEYCCGMYELNTKRLIRKPVGKNRECCENTSTGVFSTYDPVISECCTDGKVVSPGSC